MPSGMVFNRRLLIGSRCQRGCAAPHDDCAISGGPKGSRRHTIGKNGCRGVNGYCEEGGVARQLTSAVL